MLPRRHLPSLPSLLALEALDRLGTASAAEAELSLTQGAISRQLQVMADQLGITLTHRDHGRLHLTPAAKELRGRGPPRPDRPVPSLADPARQPEGRRAEPPHPARLWHALARPPRFARKHPEVTVNQSTRLNRFDFATSPFDAAIHCGRQDWPGAAYLKLMDEAVPAVAAPALLATQLQTAAQVLTLPLLQLQSRPGDWGRWLATHGIPNRRPPAMLFDHFATMQPAAIHGLGAAVLPLFLIEQDLAQNRLIPIFGPAIRATGSYYLVWPDSRPLCAPLTPFINWLRSELS